MKQAIAPIPIDAELDALIDDAATASGLKRADVMRQGLRHGVPAFLSRLNDATVQRDPGNLAFLDKHPKSPVPAKEYKKALKEKLSRKHGRPCR
jgi:hypothetical protein